MCGPWMIWFCGLVVCGGLWWFVVYHIFPSWLYSEHDTTKQCATMRHWMERTPFQNSVYFFYPFETQLLWLLALGFVPKFNHWRCNPSFKKQSPNSTFNNLSHRTFTVNVENLIMLMKSQHFHTLNRSRSRASHQTLYYLSFFPLISLYHPDSPDSSLITNVTHGDWCQW